MCKDLEQWRSQNFPDKLVNGWKTWIWEMSEKILKFKKVTTLQAGFSITFFLFVQCLHCSCHIITWKGVHKELKEKQKRNVCLISGCCCIKKTNQNKTQTKTFPKNVWSKWNIFKSLCSFPKPLPIVHCYNNQLFFSFFEFV